MKKKSPDDLTAARAYRTPGGRYSQKKQWMNCLTKQTFTYNPSTTQGGIID